MNKKTILINTLIILLIAACSWWLAESYSSSKEDAAISRTQTLPPAPAFKTTDIKNRSISAENLLGQAYFVHIWASWCAPCALELPEVLDFAAATKLPVLLVSQDKDLETMNRFLKRYGKRVEKPNIYLILDSDKTLSTGTFTTFQLPETYSITAGGRLFEKTAGVKDWTAAAENDYIKALKSQ